MQVTIFGAHARQHADDHPLTVNVANVEMGANSERRIPVPYSVISSVRRNRVPAALIKRETFSRLSTVGK